MIVALAPDATEPRLQEICRKAEALGFTAEISRGQEETILRFSGPGDTGRLEEWIAGLPDAEPIEPAEGQVTWVERSRRRFVTAILAGFGVLTGAAVSLPVVGFLLPPRRQLAQPDRVRAASVDQIAHNSARGVRFRGRPVLLIRDGERYHAVSAVCTHMNVCQVEWDASRRLLVCPCHGGAFDVHGNVVMGPPPRPLPTYDVRVQGEQIFLQQES